MTGPEHYREAAAADAFTIDDGYDRDHASDGVSRYGTYLSISAGWFTDDGADRAPYTTDPVDFAAAAWAIGSSPNMTPGFVRPHWLISGATVRRSCEDGSLLADVSVVSQATPPALRKVRGWGGWLYERGRMYEPDAEQVAARPRMLTSVRLVFSVPASSLYVPQDAPERLTVRDAAASVRRAAELLGGQVAPVLAELGGGR